MRRLSPVALALSAPLAVCAYAEVYLSPAGACTALFPGESFGAVQELPLNKNELQRIAGESGIEVREAKVRFLKGDDGSLVMVDRVIGKHDVIAYAVGFDADGKVAGVEIMEYREAYGGQVRNEKWRAQFKGKALGDPIAIGRDIKNISGATLSSSHVTQGVRRLVETYAVVRSRL
jgi:Na+-translocating ferredoxin:NAD+ oxidoreductase RnfG subunit